MVKVPGRGVTDVLLRSGTRAEAGGRKDCPLCSTSNFRVGMIPRFSSLGRHKNLFYVDNVTLKCPKCFLILNFGVPIDKEEYEEELAERKKLGLGKSVSAEMEDDARRMRERLTRLGYLHPERPILFVCDHPGVWSRPGKKKFALKDIKIVCKNCNSVLTTVEQILKEMKNTVIIDVQPIDGSLRAYSHVNVQCLKCDEFWGQVTLSMDGDLKEYAKLWIADDDLQPTT